MKTEISRDSHQPEKRYSGVYQQQGRMMADADWNEMVDILKERVDEALKDVVGNAAGRVGGTPRHRGLQLIKAAASDALSIQPGQAYVNGLQGTLTGEDPVAYDAQPDFPAPPPFAGNGVIYADLWERTVTQLTDARLRDPGLHGADTCTRKQTMLQIKHCPPGVDPEQAGANPPRGNAALSLTLQRKTSQTDPCDPCADQLDIDTRVGNYLFRVEVHDVTGDADDPTAVTLKWSSENGAEQFVAQASRDEMPEGFVGDKWVYEFFDEISERHLGVHLAEAGWQPVRGKLREIREPASPYSVPAVSGVVDVPVLVRRWDGFCELDLTGAGGLTAGVERGAPLSVDSAATSLGHVSLSGGSLEIVLNNIRLKLELDGRSLVAGDYWIVDVREVVHDPSDADASVLLDQSLPTGIEHRYLTLGSIAAGALALDPERDRKYAFPPLTEMTRIFQAGGDGQEVMPGDALPQSLRVGVGNGEWPVVGATVRFRIEAGGGSLSPVGSAMTGDEVSASTGIDGIAECTWAPDSGIHSDYRVKATLVDPDDTGEDFDPPVYFYANLVTADQVAYEPGCDASQTDTVHNLLAADTAVGLTLGDDVYYTVAEVLDAVLCKLRARHIPYDATNLSRWQDVNQEEGGATPETVQQAIDSLLENLHSEDISYTPDCPGETLPSVRSLLGVDDSAPSRVHEVLNKLLCQFDATDLPVDRGSLCHDLESLSGTDQVDTVQDAINALCRRERGGGCCDITILPGDDLEARLRDEILPGSDVHICIKNGEYLVRKPVQLQGLGHVTLQGCGFGTIVRAPDSESAVVFSDCERVVVRNISIRSNKLGDKPGSEFDHLNGALTVHDAVDVLVEHVSLRCPPGGRKMASCLTVAHEGRTDSIRVRSCQMEPGHEQVGLLVVNARHTWIEENRISVRPKDSKKTLSASIKDKDYRLSIRKIILADAVVVPRGTPTDGKRNFEMEYERNSLRFRTEPKLLAEWKKLFSANPPPARLNNRDVLRHVKSTADSILLALADGVDPPFAGLSSTFNDWFKKAAEQLPAIASQGIVCGGTVAHNLTITGNAVHGVRQGIHVGLSHREDKQTTYVAGRVLIRENHILNYLSSQVTGERHGIFIGNFNCLHIEDNHLEQRKFPNSLDLNVRGIRVHGFFGEMLQIRGNRLRGFRPGIFARAVNQPAPKVRLWQVRNNLLLEGSSTDPDLQPTSLFDQADNPH